MRRDPSNKSVRRTDASALPTFPNPRARLRPFPSDRVAWDDGFIVQTRWDGDERGRGIASGDAFGGHLTDLVGLMADPGWVAEEPEAHLLPHLQAACDEPTSLLHLDHAWSDGEIFVVELSATQPELSVGHLRHAAIVLAAAIAEESTYIRQLRNGDLLEFDVVTGSTPEGRFAPHGHLVRLRIRPST
jgi:hypothetical protein